jgi:hypothetical protein
MKYLISLFLVMTVSMVARAAVIANNNVQVTEYVYDFSVSGGAIGFINLSTALKKDLPVGVIIHRVDYYMDTAFTSGGAATVAIGNLSAPAVYLAATAFNNGAFALGNVASVSIGLPDYLALVNEGKIGITVAGAALTGGKLKLLVHFTQLKR